MHDTLPNTLIPQAVYILSWTSSKWKMKWIVGIRIVIKVADSVGKDIVIFPIK